MIKNEFIERLRNTVDIVTVVGALIEIKKAGSNYKACCPFHNENSPSFNVSPSRQSYKCFGCGAGGDAIKFVMTHKRLSYPEAISYLADQFNLTVEYDTPDRPKSRFYGIKLR